MSIFDEAARAALAGRTVRGTLLVWFDFLDQPMRVHPRRGKIRAGGFTWDGLQGLGSVSDIEATIGGNAPTVTFQLSGVSEVIRQDVLNANTQVKGRACAVYLQFFDENTLQPYDRMYTLYRGIMDRLVHKVPNGQKQIAELTAETRFARRALPAFGNLSDRDQQRRYPGDTGLFMVPAMQNRRRPWNPELPD